MRNFSTVLRPLFAVKSQKWVTRRMLCSVEKLILPNQSYIGYRKRSGRKDKPGIIFCSGFLSSLNGIKASFLDNYCQKNDLSYVCFDYVGHEFSGGDMDDFTVGLWKQNTLDVLDQLTEGPQILVGSSMGGWMSMLVAIHRSERIHSVLTIANAADAMIQSQEDPTFIRKLDDEYNLGEKFSQHSPYWLERLEDAKENSVFAYGDIPIRCPVRLLHGRNDITIPYRNSVRVAEKLMSDDVVVRLIKNGDHRFSEADNLVLIAEVLGELLNR